MPHFEGVVVDGQLDSLGLSIWLKALRNGRRVFLTADTERKPKTPKQLARYWGYLLPLYMEYVGEEDKDAAHEDVLRLCSPDDKMLPSGEIIQSVKRTRDMTSQEHSQFTERFEMFLAKHGVMP